MFFDNLSYLVKNQFSFIVKRYVDGCSRIHLTVDQQQEHV